MVRSAPRRSASCSCRSLPLFFAYVGVRTQLTLLSDATDVLVCLGVVVVATLGKLGGSAFAARATGMAALCSGHANGPS